MQNCWSGVFTFILLNIRSSRCVIAMIKQYTKTSKWKCYLFSLGPGMLFCGLHPFPAKASSCPLQRHLQLCQGPINHPVSKRSWSSFCNSTYVESECVSHWCETLKKKKLEAFPCVMWTICALHLGPFTCHKGILWNEVRRTLSYFSNETRINL